jgi:hypothetical protein
MFSFLILYIPAVKLVFSRTKIIKNREKKELYAGVNSMCTGFNLCLTKLGLSMLLL